jgi:hypothetical protein
MSRRKTQQETKPVAETFKTELRAIQEKGKDLKGEQKVFYNSIVERVANNVQVLADFREEHSQLREKLWKLVSQKEKLKQRVDLEGDIKHTLHDVNLHKHQYDRLKRERSESVEKQQELSIALENFRNAEVFEHPEETKIANMKNKLDRTNIKNGEASRLVKIYQRILYYLDRQKMEFTPAVEQQNEEIARKGRDISELQLIARDSRFSCTAAISEYRRTRNEVSEAKKHRNAVLQQKQQQAMEGRFHSEAERNQHPPRLQGSMSATPSVLRARQNRANRDKREERYRQVLSVHESVRDFFGTTTPAQIWSVFVERKQISATLQKQIDDLRTACRDLETQVDRLKSEIEEAEYASAKGVGTARLLAEGQVLLAQRCGDKKKAERELEAVATHQKEVATGVLHLKDMLTLIEDERHEEEEEPPAPITEPEDLLDWVYDRLVKAKQALDNEDQDWFAFVNKQNFALQKLREDQARESEELHKKVVKPQGFKRGPRDAKVDVVARVLDRAQVKQLAAKTVMIHAQQIRKIVRPGK